MEKRNHRVLILDNSPRHLGARWFGKWFRGLGCVVSVHNFMKLGRPVDLERFEVLVISGSPASATEDRPWILKEIDLIEGADRRGMPVLGVCFGAQLLARAYYGKETVQKSPQPEIGWHLVRRTPQVDLLFDGMPEQFTSFQYHTEAVLPQPDMQVLATSELVAVQAFRVDSRPVWGTQFHLEVTPQAGRDLLRKTRNIYEPYGFGYEGLIANARPSEAAPRLFENFLRALPEEPSW